MFSCLYIMNINNSKEFGDTLKNKPCYGSTPTLKDLPPALSSTPTYILTNSQPPPTQWFLKNPKTIHQGGGGVGAILKVCH